MAVLIVTGEILKVTCERFAGTVVRHNGTIAQEMRERHIKSLAAAVELAVYAWLARELSSPPVQALGGRPCAF